jgi:hypothetical protein
MLACNLATGERLGSFSKFCENSFVHDATPFLFSYVAPQIAKSHGIPSAGSLHETSICGMGIVGEGSGVPDGFYYWRCYRGYLKKNRGKMDKASEATFCRTLGSARIGESIIICPA